ncbi:hypothetical protein BDN72DRAFT_879967 [Pluteus cervinus]|uniref:Uncharacterized protein n=1 Tax=Pluteus cervinus TaxID=181527 RepID=A0ACD3AN54_9AGAR|nr:hypothetical protein BDN72DRAFT_879967 [Pluteus cervinus]
MVQIPRILSVRKRHAVPPTLTNTPPSTYDRQHDPEKSSVKLPHELWFKIFDFLDVDDLNSLGRVSRHLNTLVISTPLYSSRFENISDSVDITIHCLERLRRTPVPYLNDIDILSLMLDAGSIRHLTCTLDCPPTDALSTLSSDYRRLARFIQRLPNLRRITLKLEPSMDHVHPEATWVGWEDSLSFLLNACIDKGCTSFELSRGNYPQSIYSWWPVSFSLVGLVRLIPPVKRRLTRWSGVTRWGLGWDVAMNYPGLNRELFLPYRPSPMLNNPAHLRHGKFIQSNLTTLDIATPLLVHPPFSNWTYQVIATTPSLTTLAVRNIPFGEKKALFWKAFLSWLLEALKFHNVLKSLTIENCPHLPTESLLRFVQQFKDTLIDLNLHCNVTPLPMPPRLREVDLKLPNLVSLSGSWPITMRLANGYGSLVDNPGSRSAGREREVLECLKSKFTALESLTIDDELCSETDGKQCMKWSYGHPALNRTNAVMTPNCDLTQHHKQALGEARQICSFPRYDPEMKPTEFPNELWLKIIAFLDIQDLDLLGRVSRRLNYLVTSTPPYSTRFINPSESVEITLNCLQKFRPYKNGEQPCGPDDLDIFSLVLNVTSISHLTCTLNSPYTQALSSLSSDYRRLARFIRRLPNLERITINLEPWLNSPQVILNQTTWVGWEASLCYLLNACIDKGCTTFELSRGTYPQDLYIWDSVSLDMIGLVDLIQPLKRRLIYSDRATRRGLGWDVKMVKPQQYRKLFLPYSPLLRLNDPSNLRHGQFIQFNLTTLDLGTPILIHPPFSNWTYQVIATTPTLTSLAVRNIPFGEWDKVIWRACLSWLLEALKFHDVLESLTFEECPHLPTKLMIWFAQQFKETLTDLNLLYNGAPKPYKYEGRELKLDLPNLTTLSGRWWIVMELAEGYKTSIDNTGRTADRERMVLECLKVKYPELETLVIDDKGQLGYGSKQRSVFRLKKY